MNLDLVDDGDLRRRFGVGDVRTPRVAQWRRAGTLEYETGAAVLPQRVATIVTGVLGIERRAEVIGRGPCLAFPKTSAKS